MLRPSFAGAFLLAFSLFFAPLCLAGDGPGWPKGLSEAAKNHFDALQKIEYAIRDSSAASPLGIVPTNTFDRASHECHDASGQAYRLYSPLALGPDCSESSCKVVAEFKLYYREGLDSAALFAAPWKEGSGGALEVTFTFADGFWLAKGSRELMAAPKKSHPQ